MTPQELKNSILQLAIQGKLVEQRPEEGTAEELFARIQAEKQQLIKEKKIKKEKPLSEITEDEKPFGIPESWVWIRLGEISSLITKGTTPRGGNVSYLEEGIGFLRAENVAGLDKLDKTNLKYIDENTHIGYLKRSIIQENDILITIAGTLGRTAIVKKEDLPLNANQAVSMVRLVDSCNIELLYLIYALNSGGIQKYLTEQKKTTAIPNLTLEIIANCILPLPPLAEQKRIVAKIEELLPYIDRYEQAWSKLEKFNSRFPEDMKKSLLQYAVQGKLVEQRLEEGTAEELFEQIQKEKQRLIAEKKIKKEKSLPDIMDEEKPFDIPKSWMWVRLDDISYQIGDIDHKMPPTVQSDGIPYISPLNFTKDGGIDFESAKQISMEDFLNLSKKCVPEKNDIIFPRYGTIGIVRMVNTERKFLVSYSCCTIKNMENFMDSQYVFYVLQTKLIKDEINRYINKTTQPNVGLKSIKMFLFPLPPLAEQKRIVEKLKQLLPLCEQLK